MRREHGAEANGFTLVEILVALALLAALSLVLMVALHFGSTVLNRVSGRQADLLPVNDSQIVLRHWLDAAYPEYIPPEGPDQPGHIVFDGRPDSMAFLTPAPMSLVPGGMALMRLTLVKTGPSVSLQASARPELAWPDNVQSESEILLHGFTSASFAYFGVDRPGGTASWHSYWHDEQALPRLIRISITFPPGDKRHWPELLIAPSIRVDSSCQFVEIILGCAGR